MLTGLQLSQELFDLQTAVIDRERLLLQRQTQKVQTFLDTRRRQIFLLLDLLNAQDGSLASPVHLKNLHERLETLTTRLAHELAVHRRACTGLFEDLRDGNLARDDRMSTRALFAAALSRTSQELDQIEQDAASHLAEDQRLSECRQALADCARKAARCRRHLRDRLKSIETREAGLRFNPLTRYLAERAYGTRHYHSPPVLREAEEALAKILRFSALQKRRDEEQASCTALAREVDYLEDLTREAEVSLHDAKRRAVLSLAGRDVLGYLIQHRNDLSDCDAELSALSETIAASLNGLATWTCPPADCGLLPLSALAEDDADALSTLWQNAISSCDPVLEERLRSIEDLGETLQRCRNDLDEITIARKATSRHRQNLEDLARKFRRQGFAMPNVGFGKAFDLTATVEEMQRTALGPATVMTRLRRLADKDRFPTSADLHPADHRRSPLFRIRARQGKAMGQEQGKDRGQARLCHNPTYMAATHFPLT